jgi:hypothetical protein
MRSPPLLACLALFLCAGPSCQRVPVGDFPLEDGDDGEGDGDGDGDGDGGNDTGGSNQPVYHCEPGEEQEDCADGEKCTPLLVGGQQNVYECVPDQPDHATYDDCVPAPLTGQDGCPPGYVCLGDDFQSPSGVCLPLCVSDADCELALCIADAFTDVPFCSDHCDPLLPMCGHDKQDCLRTQDRFTCKYAAEGDVGGQNAPCPGTLDGGCAEGFVCVAGEIVPGCTAGFCCTSVCDLDGSGTCASPATCNPLTDDPPPGFEHIGACFVPF